ncbi:unnamed protein product [Soboliphyme baturini]|uniref:ADP-ribosylation factor-like protein 2-binding protein n=1 Tax=Soboliphyme baturini TaxID=241478 RepID=A0A183IBC1_9BILA|nr:unnamed protein product [Soboliphyme baturini]
MEAESPYEAVTESPESTSVCEYDAAIDVLEQALFSEQFQGFQQRYFDTHCDCFSDCEENKLCYMEIFQDYVNQVEEFIDEKLRQSIKAFDMNRFAMWLENHRQEVQGDLPEIVDCLTDFVCFKTAMLENKKSRHRECNLNVSSGRK